MEKDKIIAYIEVSRGNVRSFEIEIGETYFVDNKVSYDAPDGFINEGTSRLPHPIYGRKRSNLVVEDSTKSSSNPESLVGKYFDTFLSSDSRRLIQLFNETELKGKFEKQVNLLRKHIVEPMERIYGIDVLDPRNTEFWTSEHAEVDIYRGKYFNTKDPLQLMQLYCLVMNRELAPTEFQKRPDFSSSEFCINSFSSSMDTRTKNDYNMNQAIYKFMELINNDIEHTCNVLSFIGVGNVIGFDQKEELSSVFTNWINSDTQNITSFLKGIEEQDTTKGKELLNIFVNLNKLLDSNILTRRNNTYFLDSRPLASNLKDSANMVYGEKELTQLLHEEYNKHFTR